MSVELHYNFERKETTMKKILTALLMLNLNMMLLACADVRVESDPQRLDDEVFEELMIEEKHASNLVAASA